MLGLTILLTFFNDNLIRNGLKDNCPKNSERSQETKGLKIRRLKVMKAESWKSKTHMFSRELYKVLRAAFPQNICVWLILLWVMLFYQVLHLIRFFCFPTWSTAKLFWSHRDALCVLLSITFIKIIFYFLSMKW